MSAHGCADMQTSLHFVMMSACADMQTQNADITTCCPARIGCSTRHLGLLFSNSLRVRLHTLRPKVSSIALVPGKRYPSGTAPKEGREALRVRDLVPPQGNKGGG